MLKTNYYTPPTALDLLIFEKLVRLKDVTHVTANIAIPSTIRLVAETRDALLQAAGTFASERVAAETTPVATVREVTADLADAERLLQRVQHLRQIVIAAPANAAP